MRNMLGRRPDSLWFVIGLLLDKLAEMHQNLLIRFAEAVCRAIDGAVDLVDRCYDSYVGKQTVLVAGMWSYGSGR